MCVTVPNVRWAYQDGNLKFVHKSSWRMEDGDEVGEVGEGGEEKMEEVVSQSQREELERLVETASDDEEVGEQTELNDGKLRRGWELTGSAVR